MHLALLKIATRRLRTTGTHTCTCKSWGKPYEISLACIEMVHIDSATLMNKSGV